mmetsp:Transcript_6125/g.18575  ORF Transcript_6125/g.18575 Transcript_6125/m.18575 type:complete len:275 (+) Transcript_6125:1435-2259(+)
MRAISRLARAKSSSLRKFGFRFWYSALHLVMMPMPISIPSLNARLGSARSLFLNPGIFISARITRLACRSRYFLTKASGTRPAAISFRNSAGKRSSPWPRPAMKGLTSAQYLPSSPDSSPSPPLPPGPVRPPLSPPSPRSTFSGSSGPASAVYGVHLRGKRQERAPPRTAPFTLPTLDAAVLPRRGPRPRGVTGPTATQRAAIPPKVAILSQPRKKPSGGGRGVTPPAAAQGEGREGEESLGVAGVLVLLLSASSCSVGRRRTGARDVSQHVTS